MLCGQSTHIFLKVFEIFGGKCVYIFHRGQCINKGRGM
jgi:hypothetical protein